MESLLENNIFINIKTLETHMFVKFGKDGGRKMMKIRWTNSYKSWIWDQCLPEGMKWKFGNNMEKLRNFWIVESSDFSIFQILKL